MLLTASFFYISMQNKMSLTWDEITIIKKCHMFRAMCDTK